MNRFCILIALVALVGLASANFHHKGGLKHHGLRHHHHLPQHHFQDTEDFGEDFGGRHHGFDDEEFGVGHRNGFDVDSFRSGGSRHPIGGGSFEGNGKGGFGHGKRPSLGRRSGIHSGINRHGSGFEHGGDLGVVGNRFGHGRRHGSNGFGGHRVGNHGVGGLAGHGAGIVGANRRQKGFEAGLGGSNHGESNFGVEGHQGAAIAGEGHLNTGASRGENNDIEGLRKHQVINKEKTTVKDKTNGVNDVDAFRHSSGSHDDRHADIGASGIAAENSGASLNHQKEFDNEFGAGFAGDSASETVGAAGIGGVAAGGAN